MPTAGTPRPRAPKAPQDRKPKSEAVAVVSEEIPAGMELLKPLEDVPVWDQAPLIDEVRGLFSSGEYDEEAIEKENKKRDKKGQPPLKEEELDEFRSFDFATVGKIALALKPFAVDEAEYVKFCSGAGAMTRVMNLAMAWVNQLGESFASGN